MPTTIDNFNHSFDVEITDFDRVGKDDKHWGWALQCMDQDVTNRYNYSELRSVVAGSVGAGGWQGEVWAGEDIIIDGWGDREVTIDYYAFANGSIWVYGGVTAECEIIGGIKNKDSGMKKETTLNWYEQSYLGGGGELHDDISSSLTTELNADDDYFVYIKLMTKGSADIAGGSIQVDFGDCDITADEDQKVVPKSINIRD